MDAKRLRRAATTIAQQVVGGLQPVCWPTSGKPPQSLLPGANIRPSPVVYTSDTALWTASKKKPAVACFFRSRSDTDFWIFRARSISDDRANGERSVFGQARTMRARAAVKAAMWLSDAPPFPQRCLHQIEVALRIQGNSKGCGVGACRGGGVEASLKQSGAPGQKDSRKCRTGMPNKGDKLLANSQKETQVSAYIKRPDAGNWFRQQ
jgi:hypothetical protein